VYLSGLLPIINDYAANRSKYKSMDDLMPVIVEFFDSQAQAITKAKK